MHCDWKTEKEREVLLHWFVRYTYGGQYVATNVLFVSHLYDTIVRILMPLTLPGWALFTASGTRARVTLKQSARYALPIISIYILQYAHIFLIFYIHEPMRCVRMLTKERREKITNLRTRDTYWYKTNDDDVCWVACIEWE